MPQRVQEQGGVVDAFGWLALELHCHRHLPQPSFRPAARCELHDAALLQPHLHVPRGRPRQARGAHACERGQLAEKRNELVPLSHGPATPLERREGGHVRELSHQQLRADAHRADIES
eukprot:CAMPEP_0182877970 /NCGR_PEP_ID=MMETSP0034_2-20130328/15083_1 /TAXON_ID=156128 /ORGANISM="Nephroselmis pyriformis, Strain CCMP717" /LENGTH=117 /DNA_ID=CAMNT_0025010841 /DNA_START=24 /DNA_END=374 /DNA_ORIENTATION=+